MNCDKCEKEMDIVEQDSRQEWTEIAYECECGAQKVHRTEYNQKGLVTSDVIE